MIYHIALDSDWQRCLPLTDYFPSSFRVHGFIHTCKANQLAGVMARYYPLHDGLVLLLVDEQKVKSDVLFERSASGESFPHVYGAINKSAIVRVYEGAEFTRAIQELTKDG
jgi:uncharacterized protein (DUF952 family)